MKSFVVLVLAVVLVAVTVVAASAASVALVRDTNLPMSDDENLMMNEAKALFIQRGYSVVDTPETADYVVKNAMRVESHNEANLCGYLACGVFGAVKKSAVVTINSTATKAGAQVWQGTAGKRVEGSKWVGTFESASKLRQTAVKSVLETLFIPFFLQCPV